jgi:hypothetical protein
MGVWALISAGILFLWASYAALTIKYLVGYNKHMYLIKQTELFSKWLYRLKDIQGKVSILRRVDRMKKGNFGDCKSLGGGIDELRLK